MPKIEQVFKELYIDATKINPVDSHGVSEHLVYQFVMNKEPFVIKVFHESDHMKKELMAYDVTERMRIPAARVYAFGTLKDGRDYVILTRVLGNAANKEVFGEREIQLNFYQKAGELLSRFHDGVHIQNIVNKLSLDTGRITSIVKDTQGVYLSNEKYKDNFIQSVTKDYEYLKELTKADNKRQLFDKSYQIFMNDIEKVDFLDIHFGFCHNDYNEENIMIFKGEITGIMDFETAGFGNTERDICSMYISTLHNDDELKQIFFKGYNNQRPISEKFEERLPLYLIAECYKKCIWAMNQAGEYSAFYQNFLKELV